MTGRWMHVRGTVAQLDVLHPTSQRDSLPRRVLPGAYRLDALAVPIWVDHGDQRGAVGWVTRLWEARGFVCIEGILTSEQFAFGVATGERSALSIGTARRVHHAGHDTIAADIAEVSLVAAGSDPTARVREHWWIDHDDGEHVRAASVAVVAEMRLALGLMKENAA